MKTVLILSTVPDERLEMVLKETGDLGYRSVFCGEDFCENERKNAAPEPVSFSGVAADVCYKADWNDPESILRIAEKESVDGVIGLVDKAMVPVARLSKALGLPGNSPESVEVLLSKDRFRDLEERAGVFCPKHANVKTAEELREVSSGMEFPLIVKPVLCSSSFGQTVLHSLSETEEAFSSASRHSRSGEVTVEEFILQQDLHIIELDVFLYKGEFFWEGIRENWRIPEAPLRPVYDVYPPRLSKDEKEKIRDAAAKVLTEAGAEIGEFNVEGFFTQSGEFFIVEINPRQAGHYNPQDIETATGVSFTRLLITTAVSDDRYYEELKSLPRTNKNILSYSVFSMKDGILDHLYIDPDLQEKIRMFHYLHGQKEGDAVLSIFEAKRPIAKITFAFDTIEELEAIRLKIGELVYPVIR